MFCYTVSDVNKFIKQIFSYEEIFYNISIKGEISNFTHHKSGHMYFTLKDENSSIKCVMFREQADCVDFFPKNGMSVVLSGDVSVYERDGTYQIYVARMGKDGHGLIQKKLDDLKNKLFHEGLFDSKNKKQIPKNVRRIGVVTARSGAALQDIIQVLSRRLPVLTLYVYDVLVQGNGAASSISRALSAADQDGLDVLIVGRGGGSSEDLDPFNDEGVVRKICELKTPVVSAVGHETDFCLCDLAADLRAPTPSAAAEIVSLDKVELINKIDNMRDIMDMIIKNSIDKYETMILDLRNRLDYLSPKNYILRCYEYLNKLKERLDFLIFDLLEKYYNKLNIYDKLLKILSADNVLKRGYAVVFNESGKCLSAASGAGVGDILNVKFFDGELNVLVVKKNKI